MTGKMRDVAVLAGVVVLLVCVPRLAAQPVPPDTILYDFSINTNGCDPDYWNFFGPPVDCGDFGPDEDAEDGHGAFVAGDWTECSPGWGMAGGIGMGPIFGQPKCGIEGGGTDDADLDLSLGTGISMRLRLELPPGDFPPATAGKPGVRLQFEMVDKDGDGTRAVIPGFITGKPWVNRMFPPNEDETWQTVTIYFAGLDWANDAAAVAGVTPGLDISDIQQIQMTFRPGDTSENANVLHWDELTLIDTPPRLWADADTDGDVDLSDVAAFQRCFGADLTPTHPETVLFDFESGDQGWSSYGPYTMDSGALVDGSVGQGRFHVADFDVATNGFGIVDISPAIDMSAYTGMKVDARMVDVPGETPLSGPREFEFLMAIGELEFTSEPFTATTEYQTFEVTFTEMTPPPAPFHLSDPGLQIKLVVLKEGKTGVVELDYDQVTGVQTVQSDCKPMDADRDKDIDLDDYANVADCLLGAGATTDFYAWCY